MRRTAPAPDRVDAVRIEIEVGVPPADAFEVFTSEIGQWWRRGRELGTGRVPRVGTLRFEPGAEGRLVEDYPDRESFAVGRILEWQPGERLAFEWRQGNFEADQSLQVVVTFEATSGGTRVTVEHSGLSQLPLDHSARHGLGDGPAFADMWRDFWTQLLGDYRDRTRERSGYE